MDKELIAQACENLELLDIALYESSFKQFNRFHDETKLAQQNKLAIKAETGKVTNGENSEFDLFRVFIDLGIRVNDLSIQNEKQQLLYQVEATFKVDYQLIKDVNEEALIEFAHINAVHNAWPFWRQFVFSTASQANLPCPIIPLRKPQT